MTTEISEELYNILSRTNESAGFLASVLTDQQGFTIAAAVKQGRNPDIQAAVVGMVKKSVSQVHTHLGMDKSELIQLSDHKGQNLVIRTFTIKKKEYLLAVLIPDRNTAFKNATRQVVKQIKEIWKF